MDDTLIKGGTLECGCPWYHDENYPDEGHVPRHVDGCPELTQRLLYAATNLVARDLWGAHNQVVSYAAWDRGHLDDDAYRRFLRHAVDLVKDEATNSYEQDDIPPNPSPGSLT